MSTIKVGDRVAHKVSGLKGVVTHVLVEDGLAAVHYDLAQFAQTSIIEQLTLLTNEGRNWRADDAGNIQVTGERQQGGNYIIEAQGESLEAQAYRNGGTLYLDEAEDTSCPECGHETGHSHGWVVCDNCDWRVADEVDIDDLITKVTTEYERGYNDGVSAALDAIARSADELRHRLRS